MLDEFLGGARRGPRRVGEGKAGFAWRGGEAGRVFGVVRGRDGVPFGLLATRSNTFPEK